MQKYDNKVPLVVIDNLSTSNNWKPVTVGEAIDAQKILEEFDLRELPVEEDFNTTRKWRTIGNRK